MRKGLFIVATLVALLIMVLFLKDGSPQTTKTTFPEVQECEKLNEVTGEFDYGTGYICKIYSDCSAVKQLSHFSNSRLRCEKSGYVKYSDTFSQIEAGITCGGRKEYFVKLGFSREGVFCPKGEGEALTYLVSGIQLVAQKLNTGGMRYKDHKECSALPYFDEREMCLFLTSSGNPDFTGTDFCEKFSSQSLRDHCLYELGADLNDLTICEKISDRAPGWKRQCIELAGREGF